MKIFFITGTDTDIGKTRVTACLAEYFIRKKKLVTAVIKPIQTGTEDYPPDLKTIKNKAKGLYPLPPELETPYSFPLAASPHLAARETGSLISPRKILSSISKIKKNPEIDILLIEGAGGIYVPITEKYMTFNLIKDIGAPVILVSDARLGTINHSMLTIEAMKNRNIAMAGFILNRVPPGPGIIEIDNRKIIEKLSGVPCIGTVPESSSGFSLKISDFKLDFQNKAI
jgi:dethiobiotin synthetase